MASANAIYQHRSDNVARNATITIETGAPPDARYGPDALVDENPALVAKIDSTTAAWLIDFGAAQRVDLIALIHHTFAAGADVRIQANSSDSWGSPAFEAAFVIPAWLGTNETAWPVNPWLDLTAAAGYDAVGWQYWRLVITGNSQNVQLGQLWMSPTIRQLDPNYDDGPDEGHVRQLSSESRTRGGVDAIAPLQSPRYTLKFQITYNTNAQRAALRAQWDDVGGRWAPWLWVADGTVNDARLVRWLTSDEQMRLSFLSHSSFAATVEEVSRGLRPGV